MKRIRRNQLLIRIFCGWLFLGAQSFAQVIDPPVLVAPSNGSVNKPTTMNFQWNNADGASAYHLQVSTTVTFSSTVYDEAGISETSKTIDSMNNATTYYWRVRGSFLTFTGAWSETWSFTTMPVAPTVPALASPTNSAANIATNPTFTWNASTGAGTYQLQVATSAAFSTFVINQNGISTTSFNSTGLSNNTTYYWRVNASNAGGTSPFSTAWSFTTVVAAPDAPTLAVPTNNATDMAIPLTLGWNASSGASSYRFQISTNSAFTTTVKDSEGVTAASVTISGLANNTPYFWRVRAVNAGGNSSFSSVWKFTTIPAPPATPTLATPSNGASSVATTPTIIWNASSGASSYRLQISTNSSFSSTYKDTGGLTETSLNIYGLANNTTYYWRVNATNADGVTPFSNAWSFTTIVAPPSTPTLTSPSNDTTSVVTSPTLNWNASNGASSYRIQISTISTFTSTIKDSAGVTGTSAIISGLANNTKYYWRVNATNAGGTSSFSTEWSFTTIVAPPSAPSLNAPSNNEVDVVKNPVLVWNVVSGATSYHFQIATNVNFSSIVTEQTGVTTTTRQINNLSTTTLYYWRVRALNAGGPGSWSEVWNFKTVPNPPSAITLLSPANNAINVPANPTFRWNSSGGAASYNIQVSTNQEFPSYVINQNTTDTVFSESALANNTTYYWRVNASNSGGTGIWSPVWNLTTIQSAPAAPSPSSPLNGATDQPTKPTLNWTSSSGAETYRLQLATNSDFSSFLIDDSLLTQTSKEIGPLSTGTKYYWRLNAKNAGGISPWSSVANFTTTNSEPFPGPGLVSPSSGSLHHPTTVVLKWNSAVGALDYSIQVSSNPAFTGLAVNDSGITSTSQEVGLLVYNTAYYWRVRARYALTVSDWSGVWNFQTLAPPSPPALVFPPNEATDQNTTLRFTWKPSVMASTYWTQLSNRSNFSFLYINDSLINDTSRNIVNLERDSSYFWRVSSSNESGRSAWTEVRRFETIPNLPSTPVPEYPTENSTIDTTGILFSWRKSQRAGSYSFQLSTDSIFTNMVSNDSTLKDSSRQVSGLEYNKQFFWRLKASNSGGASAWSAPSTFVTRSADSYIGPDLASPVNSSINQPLSITFSWSPLLGALSYQLQIATDPNFKTLICNNSVGNTFQRVTLPDKNSKYYWRVYGSFLLFNSDWSYVWEFTTIPDIPSTPLLLRPQDGAVNQPASIQLVWTHSANVQSYHIQLSRKSDFTALLIDNSLLTDTIYQIDGLNKDSSYYWRVAAMNGAGVSNWSQVRSFKILSGEVPPTPVTVNPPMGSLVDSTTVVLCWRSFRETQSYRLQISTDSLFGKAFFLDSLVYDTLQHISNLRGGTEYFWRVSSIKTDSSEVWSEPSNFTTRNAESYAGPSLISPPDNAMNQPTTIMLEWNPDASASSYQLQVAPDANFTSIVYDNSSLTKTSQQIGPLLEFTTYFWRVRTHYLLFTSDWSEAWRFTTARKTPAAPVLIAPVNGSTNQSITPTLQWSFNQNAVRYHVQVAKDSLFRTLSKNDSTLTGITITLDSVPTNTSYYWRVRMKDSIEWSIFSPVWKFTTTPGDLPTATTDPATGIDATSVTLNATVNPNGFVTTVRFQYGPTAAYGNSVDGIPLNVNGNSPRKITNMLYGLNPNTTYHYRVSTTNTNGTAEGEDQSFTTILPQYPNAWNINYSIFFPFYENASDYHPTDYRLIGLPGASNTKIDSFLSGIGHKDWEVFWDNGSGTGSLLRFDGGLNFRCTVGRAFWLIKKGEWNISTIVPSAPLDSTDEVRLPLHSGWNLITNPFASRIEWSSLQSMNQITEPIYEFSKGFVLADTLRPYEGYYFFNATNQTSLRIPYKSLFTPSGNVTLDNTNILQKADDKKNWNIQIILSDKTGTDNTAWLGISKYDDNEKIIWNYHKPKGFGSLPVVFFNRPEWDSTFSTFATDIRAPFTHVESWCFTAHLPQRSASQLTFSGINNIPSDLEVYLIDVNASRTFNLRTISSYSFVPARDESEFRFIVGIKDSIDQILKTVQTPESFALQNNYPNPFNPETTIPVEIPIRSTIELTVHNILGQVIRKLYSGEIDAGKFWFVWNGKDESLKPVSSGIYFYRLKSMQGTSLVRKMVLTK